MFGGKDSMAPKSMAIDGTGSLDTKSWLEVLLRAQVLVYVEMMLCGSNGNTGLAATPGCINFARVPAGQEVAKEP